MRLGRLLIILLAIYLVFIGGSAYYSLIFPIRQAHHILITVLTVVWLRLRLRKGGLPQTPLNWPITAAIVVWVMSAALSIDPRMAFENLWFQFVHVLFFYMLVDLFQRGRQRLIMETVFMVGAAVVMLTGLEIASWYLGLGFIPGTGVGWIDVISAGAWLPLKPIRVSLAMNISTLLAGFVAPLVVIASGWAMTVRRKDYRNALWMLAAALLVVLILTFSRGGLLSILTAVGTIGALRLTQLRRVTERIPTRVILGVAVFAGAIVVAGYVIVSITQDRIGNTGDAGRLDMWRSAVAITQDHPLTGVGVGIFGRAFRDYRNPALVQDKLASAHNAYLNSAAETGLPGIIVSLWFGFMIVRTWFKNWKTSNSSGRKLRLEVTFAALVGLGVHSLVDVFTITPIVLIVIGLVAYCTTPTEMVYEGTRYSISGTLLKKIVVTMGIVVMFGYGVWLYQLDRAQGLYLRSFNDSDNALTDVETATALDPALGLYPLQITYLSGQHVVTDPQADIDEAINAYQQALLLEPTWDMGWMNLAALSIRAGDQSAALAYLRKARDINQNSLATLNWARLADTMKVDDTEAIITAYQKAIVLSSSLPLSDFWRATPLRLEALERFIKEQPVDVQYRVLSVYDPTRAGQLVTDTPQSAAEWWVTGEYALTVTKDAAAAIQAFSEAIRLQPKYGDYYAARARARYQTDPVGATRDLNLAELLGTVSEYPNAIRAEFAQTPEEAEQLRANALPSLPVTQEFAAVLYDRPSAFQLFPEMQAIGPGRAAMQPWYSVAETRLKDGNKDGAIRAYRAILDYAPDETEARDALAQLTSG